MLNDQRIFFSDNGVITDYTRELNNFRTGSFAMSYVAAEDHLIIGTDYPFNNQYINVETANVSAAAATVELWAGEAEGWKSAIDILDFTSASGVPLSASGHLTFKRDRDEAWGREDESTDIALLSTAPLIYGFYWLRLSWSADIAATISHVGNKFSNDDELFSLYPDFNNQDMRDNWEQGQPAGTKLTWDEQSFIAAQIIIDDMKRGNIIVSDSQLLDFEIFRMASIHKTAEIIYTGMGKPFAEDKNSARNAYKESIDIKNFRVDRNKDANLSRAEKATSTTYHRR